MSLVNDALVQGVPCQAIPRLPAIMNMHYSSLLDEFRVRCNVMRPEPVGRNVKLVSKVEGPNGFGAPMP